jgi:hypothetical protein
MFRDHAYSLTQFNQYETKRLISSPVSLEALKMEGLLPEDLLYKPLEQMIGKGVSKDVAEIRYNDREKRRLGYLLTRIHKNGTEQEGYTSKRT